MIKIEKVDVFGWEAAIRGMRNPMNSWDKSDSYHISCDDFPGDCYGCPGYEDDKLCDKIICFKDGCLLGENDLKLMKSLSKAGDDHGKFLRMINVTLDITAPLYWWKEFDTYKVGTVANSCSTMHKIHAKEFELDDFSHEHLVKPSEWRLYDTINQLNLWRDLFVNGDELDPACTEPTTRLEVYNMTKKDVWWQMIQLLPSSYNQKRTVQLNYQVLKSMYLARKHHKLDEWREFCAWCETLPYFREICLGEVVE